jgi:hypothetical protein
MPAEPESQPAIKKQVRINQINQRDQINQTNGGEVRDGKGQ